MSGLPESRSIFVSSTRAITPARRACPTSTGRSDWPDYMGPRLSAAQRLLRSSDCLACHIDDHELESLLRILRELFGRKKFFGQHLLVDLLWRSSGKISHVTEPILVYAKDRKSLRLLVVHSPTKNGHQVKNPEPRPGWSLAEPS
jgi:adenine specific DNA methylase Mod